MKTIKGIALATLLVFAGCADSGSPEAVAVKFVKALNSLDFKAASELGTDEAKKNLQMMESFMTMAMEQNKEPVLADNPTEEQKTEFEAALTAFKSNQEEMEKQKAEAAKADIKVINTTVNGDTAKVEYKVIPPAGSEAPAEGEEQETQTLDLVKVDGVWKVDLKKGV